MEFSEPTLKMYFNFLDKLRQSNQTNMFGATPYLKMAFPELTSEEARKVLNLWMCSFKKR
jgi:hypothetical protein